MKNKKKLLIFTIILLIISIIILIYLRKYNKQKIKDEPVIMANNISYDFKIIKETNTLVKNNNYLISPLSMAYALSLLNEGADGNTKKEIESLLNNYKLPNINSIENKIGIANLLFIKDDYQSDINESFINTLKNKYSSDLLFDKFIYPDKANEWISNKTYKMIPNAIEELKDNFVLGLANTIVLDVEWKNKFNINKIRDSIFTKDDGSIMNVAMMNGYNDVYYLENENAKGIIKDYKIYDMKTNEEVYEESDSTISLEYIAILPNNNINDYINIFDEKEFNNLLNSKKTSNNSTSILYSIPKYAYDFNYTDFQKMLENLNIKDAFDKEKANFIKMKNDNSLLELYVGKAIHKTHIELSEEGVKAAASTIFIVDKNESAQMQTQHLLSVDFNRPFIYIIKDKNSNNIWFFGTVYEPLEWKNN